ncbi:MAG TPA: tyrosine recombinase XerC [Bacillota bacterium]|nr:tyrosine recombinase XerC [Bacillota bacterium]
MKQYADSLTAFVEYLQIEKGASPYTVMYYKKDLETFFTFLERKAIHDLLAIDQRVVRLFLTELYDRQLSRRSVSRKISCLRTFFKFMEREQKVNANPFAQITLPKAEKRLPGFLYKEELEQLFKVNDLTTPLGQRNQALLETLYGTGMRISECQALCLEDVDFSIGTMLVKGKGGKERYVPFGRFAERALQTYINHGRNVLQDKADDYAPSNALFLNARGRPLSTRGMRLILQKIVEDAAMTIHVHPHKLRHTFATHMLNEGADLRTVQELLGHEHLSSTQIYTHVTKDYLKSVYMNAHPRANDS